MKKRLLIASAATLVGLATASGAAFAATQTATPADQTLVDKIAMRFDVDKAEVQKVFDENREEHQAERETMVQQKIDQAVTDKKLTSEQASELKAQLKQLATLRDELRDNPTQDKRDALKSEMQDLRQWFKDNNLSMRDLGIGGKWHGAHHMYGDKDNH